MKTNLILRSILIENAEMDSRHHHIGIRPRLSRLDDVSLQDEKHSILGLSMGEKITCSSTQKRNLLWIIKIDFIPLVT